MINVHKCWFSWWIQSLSYLNKVNVHSYPFMVVTGKAYVRSHDYIWPKTETSKCQPLFFNYVYLPLWCALKNWQGSKEKEKEPQVRAAKLESHKSVSNQQPATDSSLWNVQRLTSSTLWWVDSRFVRFSGRSCKYKCIMRTNNNIYNKKSRWIKVYVGKGPPVSTVAVVYVYHALCI